jgi:hypothetical protein
MEKPATVLAMEKCLQEAFAADPSAMLALAVNRVPCNQVLADHQHVIVDEAPTLAKGSFTIGPIGLINGMLHAAGVDWCMAIQFSDERDADERRKVTGFTFVPKVTTEPSLAATS